MNKLFVLFFFSLALFFIQPVQGLDAYISSDKTYYNSSDDLVVFTIELDLDTYEKIPLRNITLAVVGSKNETCIFSPVGAVLSGCGNISDITVINNVSYSSGLGNFTNSSGSYGYGHDSALNTSYYFGNESFDGYSYVLGYNYSSSNGSEIKYNVSLNITKMNVSDGTYTATFSALAKEGNSSHPYNSSSNASIVVDKTIPNPRILKPSNNAQYKEGASIFFMGNLNGEANADSYLWNSSIDSNLDTSVSVIKSSLSVGAHLITFFITDRAGQTGNKTINITVLGTVHGNESNIESDYSNLSVTVNASSNTSQAFSGILPVVISNSSQSLLEFDYNFSMRSINLSSMTVNSSSNSTKGGALVGGINISGMDVTKTLYVQRINMNINGVCIKDAQVTSISNISSACNESDETKVECDGTNQSGYNCSYNSTSGFYKVTGLNNSAIIQIDYEQASSSSSSSSSGGGGGGGLSATTSDTSNTTDNETSPEPSDTEQSTSSSETASEIQQDNPEAQNLDPESSLNLTLENGVPEPVVQQTPAQETTIALGGVQTAIIALVMLILVVVIQKRNGGYDFQAVKKIFKDNIGKSMAITKKVHKKKEIKTKKEIKAKDVTRSERIYRKSRKQEKLEERRKSVLIRRLISAK